MSNTTTEKSFKYFYNYIFTEIADPRTKDWFLVSEPYVVPITFLYLYFIYVWGPNYMKNRPPYKLKTTLIIYNFFQVLLSAWMFRQAVNQYLYDKYSLKCQSVDYSSSPSALRAARLMHVYYLAKFAELLDTVFFVLRKKYNQITFLHVYHHFSMPFFTWVGIKYLPVGHHIFLSLINSFVHIIMYFYYMMAAAGPQFQKYLWWKKYITNLQMIQFCAGFLHNFQLFFYDCVFPRWTTVFILPNATFLYYLFYDFYKEAYKVNDKTTHANNNISHTNDNGTTTEHTENEHLKTL